MRIYLDNNATTPLDLPVMEAMQSCWSEAFANPGSRHAEGRMARRVLETSRERIAAVLGADADEVVFTSGGTESAHLALTGLAQGIPGPIACTAGEHPATRETCRQLADRGWQTLTIDVDSDGIIDDARLRRLPWDEMRLVSLIYAHNETGVIQPTESLQDLCETHRVPWHLDAVQAVGKIPVDFHTLEATCLSLGAHKFGGPRGVGALLVRKGTRLLPQLVGGHQEQGRRAGTEPIPLIAGMATALELWNAEAETRRQHLQQLRDLLEAGLRQRCDRVVVHGEHAARLPNTLSIAFPGLDGEALLVALDLAGVACSLGSACASGSVEPAPALVAMGCSPEICLSSVRFSVGVQNTVEEIVEAVRRIAAEVVRLREFTSERR